MAKKGARQLMGLVCTVCKMQNYIVSKNKINTPDKLDFNRYCSKCRKHVNHKENSKLK